MMKRKRISHSFAENDLKMIKTKMLNWLKPFSIFAYLDNNQYSHQPNRYELMVACEVQQAFDYIPENFNDWIFGHISYDYKNRIFKDLKSKNSNTNGFSLLHFFQPKVVLYIPHQKNEIIIESLDVDPALILKDILNQDNNNEASNSSVFIDWKFKFSKEEYINRIQKIRNHIEEGDCYELNFCMEAFSESADLNPFETFKRLNALNPSPFAAFYKVGTKFLICASPERYIYKENDRIVSQPIKGTAAKKKGKKADEIVKEQLLNNEKERAENVMITDLVRNDLAQCSKVGSVQVSELFGVYSFPTLHHLISTVQAELKNGISLKDIIEVTFPMGSMTGAPKKIVMEIIDDLERTYRGLFSGTLGYKTPQDDFDFNVVIRSLIYNQQSKYLSYQTGGAITYDSCPEEEWEEVKLKAKAMQDVFLKS